MLPACILAHNDQDLAAPCGQVQLNAARRCLYGSDNPFHFSPITNPFAGDELVKWNSFGNRQLSLAKNPERAVLETGREIAGGGDPPDLDDLSGVQLGLRPGRIK